MKLICATLLFVGVQGFEQIAGDLARDSGDEHVGDVPDQEVASYQADDRRWMVEDGCLALKMSAEIKLYPNSSHIYTTRSVPVSATVSNTSSCLSKTNTTQVITLEWSHTDPASGQPLTSNISIIFSMNTTSTIPTYGISKVTAMFQLTGNFSAPSHNNTSNQNATNQEKLFGEKFIEITTGPLSPMRLAVPTNRSYLCEESLLLEMSSQLLTIDADGLHGEDLQQSSLTMKTIQFDGFRAATIPDSELQTSIPCAKSNPSDLVPIVVGGGLAGLVLFIVVCYVMGRRKTIKVKGYSSV